MRRLRSPQSQVGAKCPSRIKPADTHRRNLKIREKAPAATGAKTAPAASESPAQGRQFYADETPMLGNRRRSGELASGSLPFTVTGDQFSAPNNNWLGSRPICAPSFGRADPQFNPFEAAPAAWRCSRRCAEPRRG